MKNKEKNEGVIGSEEEKTSIWTIISFNLMHFGNGAAFSFIGAYALYFYEVEVGLSIFFYALAYIIFGIWDAINDPLVGYISDKTYWFTKRWGRRFPWIVFGSIPVTIFFFLVFMPPDIDPVENALAIFMWLTIVLCAYEWFNTAASVNWWSLYPQKFRTDRDRRYSTGIELLVWVLMQFFGIVVPPIFIVYGDKSSFLIAGLIIVIIAIPFIILGIPGCREDKQMIERVLKSQEQAKEKLGFIYIMKKLFRNRNFIAMLAIWIGVNTYAGLAIASTIYYVRYILQTEEFMESVLMLGLLIATGASMPIWVWLNGKIGEIKVLYITTLGLVIGVIPIIFIADLTVGIICFIAIGAFIGGLQCADEPLWGSVIDELVIKERRHTEGVSNGVLFFVLRAAAPLTTVIIAITHIATSFNPNALVQSPLAEWGIIADFAIFPAIIAILGLLVWRKLWTLSEEDRKALKSQLKELDL